ncbi:MAG: GH13_10 / GH13 / GH13_9 / GH13_11 / GH13 _8 / GH13_36 [uncultured Truepera sp.]|uniref:Malto-oligosyltrehalose trehalohydrolase n=1 Tax=uncultured Truepera sp. TaxID=543023 RepID=A0A6J4UIV5_9DEIN|nr:MAG: GH13_10 / GH13 / GH13_9 / GH13_11 / GH13 _8 / GH13_36 [uncultured Truepera sp.]
MNYPYLGATIEGKSVRFRVVSPTAARMEVALEDGRVHPMQRTDDATFEALIPDLPPGTRYYLAKDGTKMPDPASRFQPGGVHGPSEVIDPRAYRWRDESWMGVPHKNLVFYELHVGTFTQEGTYRAAQDRLPYLKELGVTAVELMPLAAFPGERNWGYDPAAQFAPAHPYGGPDDLRRFVDAAHEVGLAVYLDVVYNHFGPDGAYVVGFNPEMFTAHHHTPWGQAINLDDTGSEHVRQFFLENAVHWLREYHFDGFRLDATFALVDDSPKHFLEELVEVVASVPGWKRLLIAEDPRNLRELALPREGGGYGLDGIWADDFHHQLRVNLAGDRHSYYRDFTGTPADIAKTLEQGWFYTGQRSENQGEARGTPTDGLAPKNFVVCIQNHDQIGNRPRGNRLSDEIPPSAYRAASALLLFAPQLPLLFQGQEWVTKTPFIYFTDHNPELGKLVSEGRKREFIDFPDFRGIVPDPQDPASFQRSKLSWDEQSEPEHAGVLKLYQDLLRLRPKLSGRIETVTTTDTGLVLRRGKHLIYVALRGDTTLPLTHDLQTVLVTESGRYAVNGSEPEFSGNVVSFRTPGAFIAEVAEVAE